MVAAIPGRTVTRPVDLVRVLDHEPVGREAGGHRASVVQAREALIDRAR